MSKRQKGKQEKAALDSRLGGNDEVGRGITKQPARFIELEIDLRSLLNRWDKNKEIYYQAQDLDAALLYELNSVKVENIVLKYAANRLRALGVRKTPLFCLDEIKLTGKLLDRLNALACLLKAEVAEKPERDWEQRHLINLICSIELTRAMLRYCNQL